MSFWQELPRPFFILAPMEAVTDVVFRHVVAKAAAPDVYFTEFTNATGWVHAGDKAIGMRLVKTDDEEPIVAQIWGAVPEDIAQLAKHSKALGFHGIDINMGCPDASAVKAGGGAGMIRTPELAARTILAAKESGLPVSVKTRLGYTYVDEWREWLSHLLRQNIVNLTIHLRTKKEMSKVPAHLELIPEIIALRDEIAPNTLITINGDIENRAEGLALVEKYPGIDGVMIGRGVFHDPFCFRNSSTPLPSSEIPMEFPRRSLSTGPADESAPTPPELARAGVGAAPFVVTRAGVDMRVEPLATKYSEISAAPTDAAAYATDVGREAVSEDFGGEKANTTLIHLLNYHLDLHDQWDTPEHPRKFDPLKRFFKIYIHSFEGAAELRDKLMHTKNTAEVRAVLSEWFS